MAGKPSVMLIASTPVVSITPDSPVCDAMKLMVNRGFRRLPVVDRGTGRLVGIITATDIVRYAAGKRGELAEAMRRPVSEVMVREVVSVRTSSGLEEAIRTMVEHGVGGLPVVDEEGRLWAIVTERDIIRGLARRPSGRKVSELMSRKPVVASPDETLAEAVEKMASKGFRRLPLVGPEGKLVGMVTVMDILRRLARAAREEELGPEVLEEKLRAIATRQVVTVSPDEDIGRAAELMWEKGVGGLPVVEPGTGELVGIITERDFFKLLETGGESGAR